jgi:fumarylacetoacetase
VAELIDSSGSGLEVDVASSLRPMLNQTHDPIRVSWIDSANEPLADFPLQNLPFGVFRVGLASPCRVGVAIGREIFDLRAAVDADILPPEANPACCAETLNDLMAAGPAMWKGLRARLSELLGADSCPDDLRAKVRRCLLPQETVTMALPAKIGDYTDFYASVDHATNVGKLFRPDQPLLPNYKWLPIGYHGRSSSIVVSGHPVRRPAGQFKRPSAAAPDFGPSESLDYEVELGAFVGPGNPLGEPLPLPAARGRLFGVVLLNDWSARDIQSWEYQPLGPFLAKNFTTSLSPWVVTTDALAPFRVPASARAEGDPAPLPYLVDPADAALGGFDLTLEAWLLTPKMRAAGATAHRLSTGNFRQMYWTLAQLLTHHASNGCNLRPGDLLGSGTVSGSAPDARGCLLEITARGTEPISLPNGETRRFLEDGDEIILRGYAARPGARRIGLGECRGMILPTAGSP